MSTYTIEKDRCHCADSVRTRADVICNLYVVGLHQDSSAEPHKGCTTRASHASQQCIHHVQTQCHHNAGEHPTTTWLMTNTMERPVIMGVDVMVTLRHIPSRTVNSMSSFLA